MLIIHKEIIKNYKNLYKTKEGYDVIIYAGEEPNIKEFHTHSLILKTQSKFFKRAFMEDIKKNNGCFTLNSRISPDIFEIILSYMYCVNIDLTKLQSREVLNLLLSSEELELQSLVKYIQETLDRDHRDFIIKNILEIIELTYQKEFLEKLWNFCLQQICYESDCLFKSTKFLTFNPSILEIILKRDDFYVSNEIVIWEILLKWACGQNPVIQQDINKWNKDEFTMMEKRLSRFIQLIRFYHIPSEDFHLKVYPFKEILPNNLINNVFTYHIVPNSKLDIDIQPQRSGYVWNQSACGSKLVIEDNGRVVSANNYDMQSVRAKMTLENKDIFEWDVIIEKECSYAWVGICASENFNYEIFAGSQPTGWVLGSVGFTCSNYNSNNKTYDSYCPSFGDGAKITVHLDMNKRTCAFTVNGVKYPEVSNWNNLPSKLYPVVSLCYPGCFQIQPH
ncbi:concanavalin A-like lectin/glucanase domain-containing protein [Glomus cerebriforme]|uniref:Concanavalin A-like lectin/glucanase domain-containing protein n=1 Tax=Glomus cerebriforme TaxID=658196 RepID=A0A397S5I8_9GLOM|nr:concanavalin A-like lectin/glucanase domain-containing protein [Glomus cerebriforme]